MRTMKRTEEEKEVIALPKLGLLMLAMAHREFAKELSDTLLTAAAKSKSGLHKALNAMIDRHTFSASAFDEAYDQKKPGRPPKPKPAPKVLINNLSAVLASYEKKTPGRPVKYGPRMDRFVYKRVEEIRAANAAKNTPKLTILSVIDQMNADLARKFSFDEKEYVTGNRNSVRSAYRRGKKLTET